MTDSIVPPRLQQLEECEARMQDSLHKGIEAKIEMGRDLKLITDYNLYEERGYKTFADYIEHHLGWDKTSVYRTMKVVEILLAIGPEVGRLPETDSQAEALARVAPERLPVVWGSILATLDADDSIRLTTAIVKSAVESELEVAPPPTPSPPPPKRAGVRTQLDSDNGEKPEKPTEKPAKARVVLSDKGEEALERIGRFCDQGNLITESILAGALVISERDLIEWASYEKETVRNLAHYIVEKRWSIGRALNYESKAVNEETALGNLFLLARARGGKLVRKLGSFRITVTYEPEEEL